MTNLESALQDSVVWKDPVIFNPERHLSEDGKFIKKETVTPFGLGKLGIRLCLLHFFHIITFENVYYF